ncbi:intradiol ring-cleavage dioxygenase [Janthinobacterium sp. BJB303]|nr:intradiol ring-cleavage dioxygenase [Janthinobacterium sp. BJB303]
MDLHDFGLAPDPEMMRQPAAERRQVMRWLLAGAAGLPLAGCGGADAGGMPASTAASATGACTVIPEETGGAYPADGTNTHGGSIINVLNQSGVVRSDIRASFNGATGVALGLPLTIELQLLNASGGCASLAGYAVYLWHCDRDGLYSLYSAGVTAQNYLRGVQETDGAGRLRFTTIFPGCYAGRMPHVHVEVYPSLDRAAAAANRLKTSQFTFPMATLNEAYGAGGYAASARKLAQISHATDQVFSDGARLQMATVAGNATDGYVATLTVAVNG